MMMMMMMMTSSKPATRNKVDKVAQRTEAQFHLMCGGVPDRPTS